MLRRQTSCRANRGTGEGRSDPSYRRCSRSYDAVARFSFGEGRVKPGHAVGIFHEELEKASRALQPNGRGLRKWRDSESKMRTEKTLKAGALRCDLGRKRARRVFWRRMSSTVCTPLSATSSRIFDQIRCQMIEDIFEHLVNFEFALTLRILCVEPPRRRQRSVALPARNTSKSSRRASKPSSKSAML